MLRTFEPRAVLMTASCADREAVEIRVARDDQPGRPPAPAASTAAATKTARTSRSYSSGRGRRPIGREPREPVELVRGRARSPGSSSRRRRSSPGARPARGWRRRRRRGRDRNGPATRAARWQPAHAAQAVARSPRAATSPSAVAGRRRRIAAARPDRLRPSARHGCVIGFHCGRRGRGSSTAAAPAGPSGGRPGSAVQRPAEEAEQPLRQEDDHRREDDAHRNQVVLREEPGDALAQAAGRTPPRQRGPPACPMPPMTLKITASPETTK